MKTMRRVTVFFLAMVMALSLAACGESEKTVVMRGDLSNDVGVPTTDTFTLTAKGDLVKTLKEVVEFDLSEFDEGTRNDFIAMFGSAFLVPAQAINGVTCTDRTTGATYIIELTVDCSGNTVKEAIAAGILALDNSNAEAISLKGTQSALEQQGYKVIE